MKQVVAIACANCGEPKLVTVRTRAAAAHLMAGVFFCPTCYELFRPILPEMAKRLGVEFDVHPVGRELPGARKRRR